MIEFLSAHYLQLKALHVATAAISITLFILRFALLTFRKPKPLPRVLKILPHVNDTALLLLAALMCVVIGQAPGTTPWLTEKVAALVLYIIAGLFALKWSKSTIASFAWFVVAIVSFAHIAHVAFTKTALVF